MLTVTPESYYRNPAHRRFADEVLVRLGISARGVTRLDVSEGEVIVWQLVYVTSSARTIARHDPS